MEEDPHPEYSLFATMVHSGFSHESGHYYAYIKDAVGHWYCCNDSYVTLSTMQEVLSEKAYILFFTQNGQRLVSAESAAVSNGVKPHDINSSSISKSSRSSIHVKEMNLKSSTAPSIVKGIPVVVKNNDASANIQNKFNGFANAVAKRVSGCDNGVTDVQKKDSLIGDGNVSHSVCKQMNGNYTSSLHENNGSCRNGEHSGISSCEVLVNGDTHLKNGTLDPVKGSLCEDNSVKNREKMYDKSAARNGQSNNCIDLSGSRRKLEKRETAGKILDNGTIHNGHNLNNIDGSGSKRKLKNWDSCILLAKDAESQAKVQELKEVLKKETALLLQTCGWSDKVYKYMRSKKRVCMDACSSTDASEPKKMLIADAKTTFISQIPGSLKGSLIEHIRSFSSQK